MTDNSTNPQFLRKIALLVGQQSGQGFDLSNLHIRFHAHAKDANTPHSGVVKVYNLSMQTIQAMKAMPEFTRLVLKAGYQDGAFGVILDGFMVQARIGRDDAVDSWVEFLVADGFQQHLQLINQTMAAGATPGQTAQAAATAMGAGLQGDIAGSDGQALPRGQALYGHCRDVMKEACAAGGCSWFYEGDGGGNTNIVTVRTNGSRAGPVTRIGPDSGMIGWPVQTQSGIEVRTLLDPLLRIGGAIQLDNQSIQLAQWSATPQGQGRSDKQNFPGLDPSGSYKIIALEQRGDTRGNDWYSRITGVALDASAGGVAALTQAGAP